MNAPLHIAARPWQRLKGLLGKDWKNDELLIVPCKDVHTIGMRQPIDIAFVDESGRVIDAWRKVKPWRRVRNRNAVAVIERFSADDVWLNPGDCIRFSRVTLSHQRRQIQPQRFEKDDPAA